MITVIAFTLAIAGCAPHNDGSLPSRRDPVYAGMVGEWQGTVEVSDLLDTSKRVTRAAKVRVMPVPGSDMLEMRVETRMGTYTAADTNHLRFDKLLTRAQWGDAGDALPQLYSVRRDEEVSRNEPLQLVLETEHAVIDCMDLRETVTIAPGEIRMVQEVRLHGGTYQFQRAYVLHRVA